MAGNSPSGPSERRRRTRAKQGLRESPPRPPFMSPNIVAHARVTHSSRKPCAASGYASLAGRGVALHRLILELNCRFGSIEVRQYVRRGEQSY